MSSVRKLSVSSVRSANGKGSNSEKDYVKSAYLSVAARLNENLSTRKQLLQVMQYLGKNPSSQEIYKLWNRYDGSISLDDVSEIVKEVKSTSRLELLSAFQRIDVNGDGFISDSELYRVLTTRGEKMTHSEVRKVLETADANKDGKLDYNEFCDMMLATSQKVKQLNISKIQNVTDYTEDDIQRPLSSRRSSRSTTVREENIVSPQLKPTPTVPRSESQMSVNSSVMKSDPVVVQRMDDAVRVRVSPMAPNKLKSIQPKSFKGWTHVQSKGCFFVDDSNVITSHIYTLQLQFASNVCIIIQPFILSKDAESKKPSAMDAGVFIFRQMDDDDDDHKLTQLVSFTEVKENQQWCWRGDLRSGSYTLIPFSTGCRFRSRAPETNDEIQLVHKDQNGEMQLSRAFRETLSNMFEMCDLDGNSLLSRSEFNLFQLLTCDEEVDDEAWQVVTDNVETKNGEVTRQGYEELHLMQAREDDIEPQEELMETVRAMGFSGTLDMDQACMFDLHVFAQDCQPTLRVTSVGAPEDNQIVIGMQQSITANEEVVPIKDIPDLTWYLYKSHFRVSTMLANKSSKAIQVQVNSSQSKNCCTQRGQDIFMLEIPPNSKSIVDHVTPAFERKEWTYYCHVTPATANVRGSGARAQRRLSAAASSRPTSAASTVNKKRTTSPSLGLFD